MTLQRLPDLNVDKWCVCETVIQLCQNPFSCQTLGVCSFLLLYAPETERLTLTKLKITSDFLRITVI